MEDVYEKLIKAYAKRKGFTEGAMLSFHYEMLKKGFTPVIDGEDIFYK